MQFHFIICVQASSGDTSILDFGREKGNFPVKKPLLFRVHCQRSRPERRGPRRQPHRPPGSGSRPAGIQTLLPLQVQYERAQHQEPEDGTGAGVPGG